jgi:hypothetical protein
MVIVQALGSTLKQLLRGAAMIVPLFNMNVSRPYRAIWARLGRVGLLGKGLRFRRLPKPRPREGGRGLVGHKHQGLGAGRRL